MTTDAMILPSSRRLEGTVRVPSSKSVSHRYLNLALVAGEPVTVRRPLFAQDIDHFVAVLKVLGWRVDREEQDLALDPPETAAAEATLECGNAGTLLRFLTATLTAIPGSWTLDGTPRLRERPIGPLVEALESLGARFEYLGRVGCPPVRIQGGSLVGGSAELDAGESSQYLSAVLMVAQRAKIPVDLQVKRLTSGPYVDLTLDAIRLFGGSVEQSAPHRFAVKPIRLKADVVEVEGDYSAACYAAAGAALTGGRVVIQGLKPDSAQGDRWFMSLLESMGAVTRWTSDGLTVVGSGALQAVDADLSSMPDQVPTLAALAPFAVGRTHIRGVPHLRLKESDRLAAMASELWKLGVPVAERPDGLDIEGVYAGDRPVSTAPVEMDPHDDHRIAMSLAVVALRRPNMVLSSPQVVNKSYPEFWTHWGSLLT